MHDRGRPFVTKTMQIQLCVVREHVDIYIMLPSVVRW